MNLREGIEPLAEISFYGSQVLTSSILLTLSIAQTKFCSALVQSQNSIVFCIFLVMTF